ncbi:MAG TPA: GNAT family N-acetyltransferase [Edaphobacter sp.]
MPPAIRPATAADSAVIADIYAHYVLTSTATLELEPPGTMEIAKRMADVASRGLPYLVAEVDGQIAGYGYAGAFRPRPGYRFTVEDSVYLRPEFGGRGLGRLLLGELIRASKEAGCHQMIGVIGGENLASIAMHRAMGFVDVGVLREVGFKFGNWVDVTLMQREL